MELYDNDLYMEDVRSVAGIKLPWNKINGKTLILSGASGLLGSFLVDVIMEKNIADELECYIFAIGRNDETERVRFRKYKNNKYFRFIKHDINDTITFDQNKSIDYVLHLASNTHPIQYSTDPIGTIFTNIIGLRNMMDLASSHNALRFLFASSNEVYGENRGDQEAFDEEYCGYINSNTLRAGYPESKRCGEALCQAYRSQKGLDVVIPRLTRSYGPTMLLTDTKAISQFIKKCIAREDIVLKSAGNQYYSYQYVSDSISGLLYILLCGENGEAYNIADESSDITLKDLASVIAGINGRKVVFEQPDPVEASGYSKATKAILNGEKLKSLGWSPKYDIKTGLNRTIRILTDIYNGSVV